MFRTVAIAAALLFLSPHALAKESAPSPAEARAAQDAALRGLADGNARFVEGKQAPRSLGAERRRDLARGQHPQAVILSCSDSRVPPEHVFDQQLGDLFVVRTAGNVADEVALGSIEYAVEHLGTPVVVVLGHRSCGAVQATVEAHERHARVPGNLGKIVRLIEPAVAQSARARSPDLVGASVDANAALEARALVARSPVIAELVKAGRVRIVTAVYDLESGKVEFGR